MVSNASKREKDHFRLAFGCEGGGGGGKCVETRKAPPPACVWMRRRWWWWQKRKNARKDHLRLAFGCEGGGGGKGVGGGGGKCVETRKAPPPARVWMRGRWWSWQMRQIARKDHLRLAFGHEGGGGGGSIENVRLRLAFSCKGGGGGVGRIEFVSMGRSWGRLVLARVLDSGVVSGTVGKEKTGEKRGTTEVIPRFVTHLVGRPLPGSPPPLLPAGFHRRRRVGSNRPTSLGGGEGRGVAGFRGGGEREGRRKNQPRVTG